MARDREASGIIGFKGQGKTPFYIKLLNDVYDMRSAPILITSPSQPAALSGVPIITNLEELGKRKWHGIFLHIIQEPGAKVVARINQLSRAGVFKGGAVVLDDWNTYIEHSPPEAVRSSLINHKNFGWDLFGVSQSLIDYPAFMRRHTSSITLFKTADEFKNENDFIGFRYPNPGAIYRAWQQLKTTPKVPGYIQKHITIRTGV